MTNSEHKDIFSRVEEKLSKIRPYIKMHGGDVTLEKISEGVVTLKVHGACVGCPMAKVTYDTIIKSTLIKEVPGVSEVIFDTE